MNNKKPTFYREAAYFIGIFLLSLSAALMQRSDFGLSMVIAPAYILHLKIAEFLPWFSFGMAAYTVQFLIICILWIIMRSFRPKYLFSFCTAVLYGFLLDFWVMVLSYIPPISIAIRILFFVVGMVVCSLGVALIFHTYFPPEAYELFVKEVSGKYGFDVGRCKTCYDLSSCLIAVILSFTLFGLFEFKGVNVGTVICALLNGFIIGAFSKLLDKIFEFKDRLPLRKIFE